MDLTTPDRERVIDRIAVRLPDLDDDVLRQIDWVSRGGSFDADMPDPAPAAPAEPVRLNRRQLLAGLLVGGAAVAGTGAAGAPFALRQAYDQGVADGREAVKGELGRLRGLVDLYEALESTPLDEIVGAGVAAVGGLIGGLKAAAGVLRGAVEAVDGALAAFEATLPTLEQASSAVQSLADDVGHQLESLRQLIGDGVERAQPLGNALGGFLSGLVQKLPFGIGERATRVFDAIGQLVASLPELLTALFDGLLKPLAAWFPTAEPGSGIQAGLFTPLRQSLLVPLRDYLDSGENFFAQWESQLASPTQQALADRSQIRTQIAEYRRQYKV